jgi:hypothetical protein
MLPRGSINACSYKAPDQTATGCGFLCDVLRSRCYPSWCHGRSGLAYPLREAIDNCADDDTNRFLHSIHVLCKYWILRPYPDPCMGLWKYVQLKRYARAVCGILTRFRSTKPTAMKTLILDPSLLVATVTPSSTVRL